jgi:F0F1-type ATP synthase assembly protein I
MNRPDKQGQDEFRSAITMTVIWVAGLTLVVIFVALFAGILLDKVLGTKSIFTIVLMITSIPATIYLTLRVVRKATGRIQPAEKKEISKEEPHRGENN